RLGDRRGPPCRPPPSSGTAPDRPHSGFVRPRHGRRARRRGQGFGDRPVEEAETLEAGALGAKEGRGGQKHAHRQEGTSKSRETHQCSTVIRPDSVCSPTRRRYTYTPAARGCPAWSAGDQRSVTSPASWWVSISVMTSRPRRS